MNDHYVTGLTKRLVGEARTRQVAPRRWDQAHRTRLKSGFYAWKKRPKPERARRDAQLAATVAGVHQKSRRTYGSPRVHRELKARGVRVGKKRIERLMRENGIKGRSKRRFKRTTDSRHGGPIAPNLLARKFDVRELNHAWVTDVTAIATDEGWLFLAPMIDLCSRRVVACSKRAQRHGAGARRSG